jgi:hypothetical protein
MMPVGCLTGHGHFHDEAGHPADENAALPGSATGLIRHGQRIRVHGTEGCVEIVPAWL